MPSYGRRPRHYRNTSHRRLHPLALIAICVGGALIITLVVGNLLKIFLDEEAYNRLVSPNANVTDPIQTDLPDIQAQPFLLGSTSASLPNAVSVNLNRSDGKLLYKSPVSAQLTIAQDDKVDLSSSMSTLSGAYVSGVFFPQSFKQPTNDLQYATALSERALLNEFFSLGGDDILLTGISIDSDSLPALINYVSALKSESENAVVGIAVPLDVVKSENGWESLSSLLKVCDFCAMDIKNTATPSDSDHTAFLNSLSTYLVSYDMRLLLSQAQTELVDALHDTKIDNYQILPVIPATTTPDDAQG